MKKLLMISFVLLFAACQPTGESEHKHESHDHENHTDHTDHAKHAEEKTPVTLNDGERWEANPETTEGIENMENLIVTFKQENGVYEDLQNDLQSEFRDIFKKCTMTGEAHDQLHNYLIPLKEKLVVVSGKNLEEISSYLETYSDYFK